MEFFRIRKDIPFMRYARVLNAISALTFALAVFFLFSRGLHLSVEFTGGTLMEVTYSQPAKIDEVRSAVEKLGYKDVLVQNFGSSKEVMIRLPLQKGVTSVQQSDKVMQVLKTHDASVSLHRVELSARKWGKSCLPTALRRWHL